MKLFCFSYAGGSATVYSKWQELCDSTIEVVPVELPGRGTRFAEPLCNNMDDLMDDIMYQIEHMLLEEEYMLYGHSMGSWIVYYLLNRIEQEQLPMPAQIFLSGKEAPHIDKAEELYHTMEDKEFTKRIFELGGTPKEFLEYEELLEIFLPILKNDYQVIETCEYIRPRNRFKFNITVFNGVEDDLTKEDIYEWRRYTSRDFFVFQFNGGHFFIHEYARELVNIINNQAKMMTEEAAIR